MKDLGINRFLDMQKYLNANLFKKVVKEMKERSCVCTVEQVHHQWRTLKNKRHVRAR